MEWADLLLKIVETGIIGIFTVVFMLVIAYLYRRSEAMNKENQEKYIEMLLKVNEKYDAAINRNTTVVEKFTEKLDVYIESFAALKNRESNR